MVEKIKLFKICPKCGKKMGIGPAEICAVCRGVKGGISHKEISADFNRIVKEIKKVAPKFPDAVSKEEISKRKATIKWVPKESSWYMRASYKMHDTSYRDKDPYAFTDASRLIERFDAVPGFLGGKSSPSINVIYPSWMGKPMKEFHENNMFEIVVKYDSKGEPVGFIDTIERPLSMAVKSKAQDPEIMARRMPGRNVGYTKNGIKPKCPICGVTVSDFGMCPVCLRTVTKRFNANGNPVVVFNDKGPVYDRYVKPENIELYVKRKNGDKITKEAVGIRTLDTKWLRNESITKENFSGTVNKKSDGRSPRGEIPDAKDPERMTKFRHTPAFKLDFQVKTIRDEGKPRYAYNDIPVIRVKRELNECPECGCKTKMSELRRGDKLCPRCGLVLGIVKIHLNAMEDD